MEFWKKMFGEWINGKFLNFVKKSFCLKNGKIENFGILEKQFF